MSVWTRTHTGGNVSCSRQSPGGARCEWITRLSQWPPWFDSRSRSGFGHGKSCSGGMEQDNCSAGQLFPWCTYLSNALVNAPTPANWHRGRHFLILPLLLYAFRCWHPSLNPTNISRVCQKSSTSLAVGPICENHQHSCTRERT